MSRETGDPTPQPRDDARPQPRTDPHTNPEPTPETNHDATVVDEGVNEPEEQTTDGGGLRWRLSRQMTIWTILVPLVAVLAGALFSASSGAAQGTDLRSAVSTIPDLIRAEDRRAEIRAREVARLQQEVDTLTEQQQTTDIEIAAIVEQSGRVAREAGTTPVTGAGLSVSLTDSPLRLDQIPSGLGITVDELVVHQQDVQAVVNALWRGGAEAMMIQDQRVISTSAVRCVGNTLILQGRVYSPPFVITAIGDQERLQDELARDPAIINYQDYVQAVGLGYEVKLLDAIEAPAYTGAMRLQHAQPIR